MPLSLEDNGTILGTMSILDKLTDQFKLPSEKKDAQFVPFNSVNNILKIELGMNRMNRRD